jgi:hypothetical protein
MISKELVIDHVLEKLLQNTPRLIEVGADALKEQLEVIARLET